MAEIDRHCIALHRQLAALGLQAIDVAEDGNCFFCAASRALYNIESHHGDLRNLTANKLEENGCILDSVSDMSPDENLSFEVGQHVNRIRTPGVAVKSKVIIHFAFSKP